MPSAQPPKGDRFIPKKKYYGRADKRVILSKEEKVSRQLGKQFSSFM